MPTVVRRSNDVDLIEDDVAPSKPVPAPLPQPRPSSPVTARIEIPDGTDPAAIALQVLGMAMGVDAARSFRTRAAQAQADIGDQVEEARLRTDVKLDRFISLVAVKLRVRDLLTSRADTLEGRPGGRPADVDVELTGLVMSVARWADGNLIRQDRARLISSATLELAEVTTRLTSGLPSSVRESHGSDPSQGWHAKGLITREDEWLRRYETALIRRADLGGRLARLGRDRGATATAVVSAIATAGASKVAELIAPRMPADTSRVSALEAELGRMGREIGRTDAQTTRFKLLTKEGERLQAELAGARQAVLAVQADAAAGMIGSASTGDLPSIRALEALVGGLPALKAELSLARGSGDELAATIGLLLEESDLRAQAEVERIAAMGYRRP
jgi:hypothetical protein